MKGKKPQTEDKFNMDPDTDVHLELLKENYLEVHPPERIDDYIMRGIRKGEQRRGYRRVFRLSGIAATIFLFVFLSTIQISPSFAQYVENLPIVRNLSLWMDQDRGVMIAVEQDYVQHVDRSVERGGITLTIDELIVDEARMIVFYTITNATDHEEISPSFQWLDAETGEELERGAAVGTGAGCCTEQDGKLTGSATISWKENTDIPSKVTMNMYVKVPIKPGYARMVDLQNQWKVNFSIDSNSIKAKRIVDINKSIELDGQEITFLQATLHATVIKVDFSMNPQNSKQIFSIEDLHLIDETGTKWHPLPPYDGSISYVHGASRPREEMSIYFEGSLLSKPKSLEIAGSTIRALDKDKREILVDLNSKTLVKAPDERIQLTSVKTYPKGLELEFEFANLSDGNQSPDINIQRVRTWEETWLDLKGYDATGASWSQDSNKTVFTFKHTGTELWGEYITNPVIFRIYDYGYEKIHQPFKIKIY